MSRTPYEGNGTGYMTVVNGIYYGHADTFYFYACGTSASIACSDGFQEWDLAQRFTQLTGQLALDDSSDGETATVTVTLDGAVVASGVVSAGNPFPVNVNVSHGARLRIDVLPDKGPAFYAFADGRLS